MEKERDRRSEVRSGGLDTLTGEFEALLERMQTPEARAALRQAFGASPEELGRAAVEAARRRSNG